MLHATAKTYRNAYAGLSRDTWLLSVIMLINRSGTMVVPFMTLYLTSPAMGYSVGKAGIVFGLFGFGALCGAWVGGRLTDRLGFYPVQMIALIGGGVLFIVLGQMRSFESICLVTYLLSFVNEAFRPANSTAIAFYSKTENRTRSYSLNRLAINVGWALGSAAGGFIAHYNYHLLFWVDGFTNISAALIMWLFLRPVNYRPNHAPDTNDSKGQSAYRDKTYLWFIVITVFFATCFFQLFTNLPVFFKQNVQLSEPFIGLLMASNGIIIAVVEMVLVYKLQGRERHPWLIPGGVLLFALGIVLLNLPFMNAALAFACIVMVTFGEILSMPFMNTYWISRTAHHNRGEYAALYTMAWSAAQCLGPLLGAQLANRAGFTALWWVIGSCGILAAVGFYRLLNRE